MSFIFTRICGQSVNSPLPMSRSYDKHVIDCNIRVYLRHCQSTCAFRIMHYIRLHVIDNILVTLFNKTKKIKQSKTKHITKNRAVENRPVLVTCVFIYFFY